MDIALQRLRGQQIDGSRFADPAALVTWMGAVQAQDYGQSLWAIGLRTRGATRHTVETAIESGHILRTWPMRGTVHFVPAQDAAWMLGLSAPRLARTDKRRMDSLNLTEAALDKSANVLHDALKGSPPLARQLVLQKLNDAGVATDGQRGYHILWRLALAGLICIGPTRGKQQTFAWLADWAPTQRKLEGEEALAELARRYIRSHGPAAIQDFATWSGQNLTNSRRAFAAIETELATHTQEGRQYFYVKDLVAPAAPGSVHLLAGFDEYLLGYKDRRDVLHADHANKIVPGGNGIFLPMIIVDGQIVGTWKRTMKPKAIDVTIETFVTLSPAVHQKIHAELDRYSAFMELPLGKVAWQ